MKSCRQVKLRDVARAAGVSPGAASRVLNSSAKNAIKVMPATRERILKAAQELHYRPNLTARAMSGNAIQLIGIVNANVEQYHVAIQLNQLMRAAAQRNYYTLVDIVPVGDYVVYDRGIVGLNQLLSYNPDGLIFMNQPHAEILDELNCPSVVLSSKNQKNSDIFIDREAGGYLAGCHLLSHGRKKALFVTTNLYANQEKFAGLLRAWREAQLPDNNIFVVERDNENIDYRQVVRDALAAGADCALCSNDFIGLRFMGILHEIGVKCPTDFSVLGFDGDTFCNAGVPRLTTIAQPFGECANYALDLLIAKITAQNCDQYHREGKVFLPRLFLGGSCGCINDKLDLPSRFDDQLFLEDINGVKILDYANALKVFPINKFSVAVRKENSSRGNL